MVVSPGSAAGQALGGEFPKRAGLDLGIVRHRHFVLTKEQHVARQLRLVQFGDPNGLPRLAFSIRTAENICVSSLRDRLKLLRNLFRRVAQGALDL